MCIRDSTSVIIGAKRVDQLDDNLAATAIRLTAEELALSLIHIWGTSP